MIISFDFLNFFLTFFFTLLSPNLLFGDRPPPPPRPSILYAKFFQRFPFGMTFIFGWPIFDAYITKFEGERTPKNAFFWSKISKNAQKRRKSNLSTHP